MTKESDAREEIFERPIAFRRRSYSQEGTGGYEGTGVYAEHDIILHSGGRIVLESGAVLPREHPWVDGQIIGQSMRLREVRVCSFESGHGKDYVHIVYEDGRRKMHRLANSLAG